MWTGLCLRPWSCNYQPKPLFLLIFDKILFCLCLPFISLQLGSPFKGVMKCLQIKKGNLSTQFKILFLNLVVRMTFKNWHESSGSCLFLLFQVFNLCVCIHRFFPAGGWGALRPVWDRHSCHQLEADSWSDGQCVCEEEASGACLWYWLWWLYVVLVHWPLAALHRMTMTKMLPFYLFIN